MRDIVGLHDVLLQRLKQGTQRDEEAKKRFLERRVSPGRSSNCQALCRK